MADDKKRKLEDELTSFIGSRSLGDELSRTKENILSNREKLFGRLSQVNPAAINRAVAMQPELDTSLESMAGNRLLDQGRQRLNLLFNNAYDMAVRAGKSRREAEDFAWNVRKQAEEQEFLASEAEKKRQAALRGADVADLYSRRGVALQQEYAPSYDYAGALLRAGTLLGGYPLGRYLERKTASQPVNRSAVSSSVGRVMPAQYSYLPEYG